MAKDTRTYSGHWDAYIYGPEHGPKPSRWRWVKDGALGAVGAFFLGYSLGLLIATGAWSALAGAVGIGALLLLAVTLALGQAVESTHQTTQDLLRVGMVIGVVFVATLVVTAFRVG